MRQIDETLNMKANKAHLTLLEQKFKDSFVSISSWHQIQNETGGMMNQIQNHLSSLNNQTEYFEIEMRQKLETVCEKLMDERFKKYEKVCNDFGQFFIPNDLEYVLNSKAEMRHIKLLSAQKLEKRDFLQEMNVLNDKMNHLGVQLLEISRYI